MMLFEPVPIVMVMMVCMMRMLVCHGMGMSFVREEMRMFIVVLAIISCHFAKYVRELSYYSGQLHSYSCRVTTSYCFLGLT